MTKRHENPLEDRTKNKRTRIASPSNLHENAELSDTVVKTAAESSSSSVAVDDLVAVPVTKASGSGMYEESVLSHAMHPKNKKKSIEPNQVKEDGVTTVQTIVPQPTTKLLDEGQVACYEDSLRSRLQKLSVYVNESASVYALGKLLPTATWGAYQPGNDHRNDLCNPATNRPLTIWMLGHIVSSWFARDGMPVKQAAITVVPLSMELGKQTATLLSNLCVPITTRANEYGMNLIRVTKWQSAQNDAYPTLFKNVYDATEALQSKQVMTQYDVLQLQKDDLVLIECKVTRYHTKDDDSKGWGQRSQMDLIAISLLHKGVDRAPAAEHDEVQEIDDLCI